jgi:deazaflavin-dependent oxidoreductase (nitroreductase family)
MRVTLTTTGRRSGESREATLYAWPDGGEDRLVLVASQGGKPVDPAWAHNLRAHPACGLNLGKRQLRCRATEVPDGAERDRLWALVTGAFPMYRSYQRKTERQIPLFVLEPDLQAG